MCKLARSHNLKRPYGVNIFSIVNMRAPPYNKNAHKQNEKEIEPTEVERRERQKKEKMEKKSNKPAEKRKI